MGGILWEIATEFVLAVADRVLRRRRLAAALVVGAVIVAASLGFCG